MDMQIYFWATIGTTIVLFGILLTVMIVLMNNQKESTNSQINGLKEYIDSQLTIQREAINSLKEAINGLKEDMVFVKTQVSNHLPTRLDDTNRRIDQIFKLLLDSKKDDKK